MDLRTFAEAHIREEMREGRILIVDDEPILVKSLTRVLQAAGFRHIESTSDPTQASYLYLTYKPDVLVLDLNMPKMDGLQVMQHLTTLELDSFVPILVLSGETDPALKLQALSSGARDYLSKPFPPLEAVARVRNLLEISLLRRQRIDQNKQLEEEVLSHISSRRTVEFEVSLCLAKAAGFREDPSGHHLERVGHWCEALALRSGIARQTAEMLRYASSLHDLGRAAVSEEIWRKPGPLSAEERRAMQKHALSGSRMLEKGYSELLKMAEEIARTHHERWDGAGYPAGLQGEEIPISGRLVALCDSFDAMIRQRPYCSARSTEEAVAEILQHSGSQFDPGLSELFVANLDSMVAILERFPT